MSRLRSRHNEDGRAYNYYWIIEKVLNFYISDNFERGISNLTYIRLINFIFECFLFVFKPIKTFRKSTFSIFSSKFKMSLSRFSIFHYLLLKLSMLKVIIAK